VTDTNPLLREFDLPPYSEIRPEHVEPAVDTVLGDNRVALQELRSEEHTSELQSPVPISYAVFCLTKKNHPRHTTHLSKRT